MTTTLRVPALGNDDTVVVTRWLARVGDEVTTGATLVTVETAKSSVDIEAPADGILLHTYAEQGEELAVHAPLAAIGARGQTIDPMSTSKQSATRRGTLGGAMDITSAPTRADHPPASPRARTLAERYGLDLAAIMGTGPRGLVVAADVVAIRRSAAPDRTTPVLGDAVADHIDEPPPAGDTGTTPLSRIRRATAERMSASLTQAAQLTLHRRAAAGPLMQLLSRLREASLVGLPRTSINDLVLFAVARALRRVPTLNAHFDWSGITRYPGVNLGFAVDTPRGLLVPTIHAADTLSLAALANCAHGLADAAASGSVSPELLEGATFTVSNLGNLGIEYFTPIINLPQVAILGVGAVQDGPSGAEMPLSLTIDHRAADGADGARLVEAIAESLQQIDVLLAT